SPRPATTRPRPPGRRRLRDARASRRRDGRRWPRTRRGPPPRRRDGGSLARPLALQDRVHELALPLALHPLVLDELALEAHPELLEHAGGRGVTGLGPTDHAVKPGGERPVEDRAGRLRRVAL